MHPFYLPSWLALLAFFFASATGWAQEPAPKGIIPLEVERARGLVYLENHGSFRARSSFFAEPGRPSGETPLMQYLLPSVGADMIGEDTFWGSDLRFRYEPRLHISDAFELNLTLDVLKDYRLGSARRGSALDNLEVQGVESAGAHENSPRDTISAPRLYGDWTPVSGLKVRLGRMPVHFGLGLEENSGDCEDCNSGTVMDGIDLETSALGTGFRIAWWWPTEGMTHEEDSSAQGQPYDLSDLDDTTEWLFEVGPPSLGILAEAERVEEARGNAGWLFDWAARFKWRTADLQSDRFPKGVPCQGSAPGPDTPYDCYSLIPRDLDLWTPGLFFQLRGWPAPDRYIELGLEIQGKLGSIGNIFDNTPKESSAESVSTSREIEALGAAFVGAYQQGAWTLGLRSGLATGDPEGSFLGLRDGSNTVALGQTSQAAQEQLLANRTFEQYAFHADFITDVLLFREVIGAVTNTAFVRPELAYRFNRGGSAFTVDAGVLAAWALAPEATPGKSSDYGIEADLKLSYLATDNLRIICIFAGLKPGQALAMGADAAAPAALYSSQLDLFISF